MKYLIILLLSFSFFACQRKDFKQEKKRILIVSAQMNAKGKPPGKGKPKPLTDTTTPPPTDTVVISPPVPSMEYVIATGEVTDQGTELGCVAHAVCNAMAIDWYYKTGTMLQFSTEFLYNQTKFSSDCGSGSNAAYALSFVQQNGVCRYSLMPDANGCATMPTDAQRTDALGYRIGEVYYVTNTDRAAIRALLQAKRPVIVTININSEFLNAGPGFIWKPTVNNGLGHTLIICGYDDSKSAWKVMNSYGGNWADGGFGWIDYDGFEIVSNQWGYVL